MRSVFIFVAALGWLCGCGSSPEPVFAYDLELGTWTVGPAEDVSGDERVVDGRLVRHTSDGWVDAGPADIDDLLEASRLYDRDIASALPQATSWVLVLGGSEDAGHHRLSDLVPGTSFAFAGRLYETRSGPDGELQIRSTGDVISVVSNTLARTAAELFYATVELPDGTRSEISATGGHPFYVPAERTYRPLRSLELGTVLHTRGDEPAVLVSLRVETGASEVYNFEVAGLHNYYVGSAELSAHNAKCKTTRKKKKKGKEHTKNKRKSTKNKHQKGQGRKRRDGGGEKGDKRRPFQR